MRLIVSLRVQTAAASASKLPGMSFVRCKVLLFALPPFLVAYIFLQSRCSGALAPFFFGGLWWLHRLFEVIRRRLLRWKLSARTSRAIMISVRRACARDHRHHHRAIVLACGVLVPSCCATGPSSQHGLRDYLPITGIIVPHSNPCARRPATRAPGTSPQLQFVLFPRVYFLTSFFSLGRHPAPGAHRFLPIVRVRASDQICSQCCQSHCLHQVSL